MESRALDQHSNKHQKIADNLKALFEQHKVDISEVANALGLPVMTVRRLLVGETTDPRISTLKLIANHFDVSVDTLIEGDYAAIESVSKSKPYFVPILDWGTAEKINNIEELNLNHWKKWQPVSLSDQDVISKKAFALESRPSMYPRFPQGSIFIIDPETAPRDGDIVLIKIKSNNELTMRELVIDPPEWHLQPIVPGSNGLQYLEKNHKIVGVNLMTLLYNRKNYD